MIEVRGLTKRYGQETVLHGINFRVEPGELYAYLGPNGAGKTTTVRIMTGLAKAGTGAVHLDGINALSQPLSAKRRCGVVFQTNNLDAELSVLENLDIHGRLFGMPRQERRSRLEELLDFAGLTRRAQTLAGKLSGGLARRLMIVRALMHAPAILFLDEPSTGLDPDVRRRLWALIKGIQSEGTTIFLTTHYIEEAEFLADRVAFLDEGRIVQTGAPDQLVSEMGSWAVDMLNGHAVESAFFPDREAAGRMAAQAGAGCTVRPVNLEDCFLALTGKHVKGPGEQSPQTGRGKGSGCPFGHGQGQNEDAAPSTAHNEHPGQKGNKA